MKYKSLLIYFLLIINVSAQAQNINVKSFKKLPTDQTARVDAPKEDQNGDLCAIVKVITTENGFSWEAGSLGIIATEKKDNGYWIYIPYDSKRLTIKHNTFGVLRNYIYPERITEATVYEMVLETTAATNKQQVEDEIKDQWVIISTEPTGAKLYIDDKLVGTTPFQQTIPLGQHTYRIAMPMYDTDAGVFELSAGKRFAKSVKLKAISSVTDKRDGQVYNIVQIGEQVWMKENMNYPVGQLVEKDKKWKKLTSADTAWCYNPNNLNNSRKHGILYTWNAAQQACPEGWHMPTNEDWDELGQHISTQYSGIIHTKKTWKYITEYLRATPTGYGDETKGFDFKILFAGYRDAKEGDFQYYERYAYWWTNFSDHRDFADYRFVTYNYSDLFYGFENKWCALPVRCVQDK